MSSILNRIFLSRRPDPTGVATTPRATVAMVMMGALVALVFVAGSAGCTKKRNAALPPATGAGAPAMPALPAIETGSPGSATGEATTVAATEGKTTGTTYPRAEAQVGPNMGGVITKIHVDEGERVKRGQTLFRQDARDGALRVQQARTALKAARVNLNAIKIEYDRTRPMLEQNAVNRAQWDQLEARHESAKVGVQQAQVALDMAQKMAADATVRSPISGIVTAKLKNAGEMATMMPPTVVLVIQDQSALELRFRLPESALARVKAGDRIRATFPSLEITREAKVVRVQPSVDARTRTVELVAELPNGDGTLRPGLLAEVEMTGDDRSGTDQPGADEAGDDKPGDGE